MTFNRGGLSTYYAADAGQINTLDGVYLAFIVREATLTSRMDEIESHYLRSVSLRKFGANGPVLRLTKGQVAELRDFLTGVLVDIQQDTQL